MWTLLHIPNSVERKAFYEYLENHHPHIRFQGTLMEQWEYESYGFLKCGYGCHGTIYLNKYCQGLMENNQDESTYGDCDVCGQSFDHESNYDDSLPRIRRNNVVVVNIEFEHPLKKRFIPAGDEFFNRKRMKKYLSRIKDEIKL